MAKVKRAVAAWCLLTILLSILPLTLRAENAGVFLQSGEVLFCADVPGRTGRTVAVVQNAGQMTVLCVQTENGTVTLHETLSLQQRCIGASFSGGELIALCDGGNKTVAYLFYVNDLQDYMRFTYPQNPMECSALQADDTGNLYAVRRTEPTTLRIYPADGRETVVLATEKDISQVYVDRGQVYVLYSDGTAQVFASGCTDFTESGRFSHKMHLPVSFCGVGYVVDAVGSLYALSENGANWLCSVDIYPRKNTCLCAYAAGRALYAEGTTLYGYFPQQQLTRYRTAPGKLCALSGTTVFYDSDGLYAAAWTVDEMAPIVPTPTPVPTAMPTVAPTATSTPTIRPTATPTTQPTATPTTQPTATPTTQPTAAPLPALTLLSDLCTVRGEWLFVPQGMTPAALKSCFAGGKTLHTEKNGKTVKDLCRTGMQLTDGENALTVVILGDCNGTGTVNTADMTAMQKHILGEEELEPICRLAADLDGDGQITCADTVWLAAQLG